VISAIRHRQDTRSRIGIRTLSSWKSSGSYDQTYLDGEGLPHSEDLRITERYRRHDFGHLVIEFTFTDPKTYEGRGPRPSRSISCRTPN